MQNHTRQRDIAATMAALDKWIAVLEHKSHETPPDSPWASNLTRAETAQMSMALLGTRNLIYDLTQSIDRRAELRRQRLEAKAEAAYAVMAHAVAQAPPEGRWAVNLTTYNAQAVLEVCRLAANQLAVRPDELAEQPTDSAPASEDIAKHKTTSSTSASARQVGPCRTDSGPAEPWPSGDAR